MRIRIHFASFSYVQYFDKEIFRNFPVDLDLEFSDLFGVYWLDFSNADSLELTLKIQQEVNGCPIIRRQLIMQLRFVPSCLAVILVFGELQNLPLEKP